MKKLKSLLEKKAGEEEIEWIIPHPFLPPRYRKVCENRNMILLMDRDYVLHIRWEGARRGKWCSPTPGEARRLVREVKRKMTDYGKQLSVYSNFLTEWAETPFINPAEDDVLKLPQSRVAVCLKENGVVADIDNTKEAHEDMGGESPMPLDMEFFA